MLAVEVKADRFLRRMVRILVREGPECLYFSWVCAFECALDGEGREEELERE